MYSWVLLVPGCQSKFIMKAAWIEQFGGTEVINVSSYPEPVRKTDEVLVKMLAATLNHHDIYLRRGEAGRCALPVVLGSDGVGVVVDADPSSSYRVGQYVVIYPVLACGSCINCKNQLPHKCISFGMIGGERNGTHAEYVVIPEKCLVLLPQDLNPHVAASISLAGLTAWNMVVDEGIAQSGEQALVFGASGGVGVFVVFLLKRLGVTVHAVTSSPAKRDALYSLGVDHVLDDQAAAVLRHTAQLPNRGVDLAFNCVGGSTWRYTLPAVRSGGRILVCGTVRSPIAEIDLRQIFYRNISLIGCTMGTPTALSQILSIAATDSKFHVPIDTTVSLDEIVRQHDRMEAASLVGKIIIQMA